MAGSESTSWRCRAIRRCRWSIWRGRAGRAAEAGIGLGMHLDQGFRQAAPASARLHQPHEEVRILGDGEGGIEAAEAAQSLGAEGDSAAAGQADDEAPRARPALPALHLFPPVGQRIEHAGPAEIGCGRLAMGRQGGGKEARQQLVVIVQEGGDRGADRRQSAIARRGRPLRALVAQQLEARIGDGGEIERPCRRWSRRRPR